jgi:RNA polymerase sigma factor (sigma-70 family)
VSDDYPGEVAELQAIAARDPEAFTGWFARHEIVLKRSLRSFASIVDVEAVVQDTAIRVWERASGLAPDGRSGFLVRWAVTVAMNNARNQARRAGRSQPLEAHSPGPSTYDRMPDPALRTRIQTCRERLPSKLRLVMDQLLADGGQQSCRELAVSIGISFDAIRQNLSRARRALEKCLESYRIDVREYLR